MGNTAKQKDFLLGLRQAVASDLATKQAAAVRALKDKAGLTPEQRQELCALAEQMRRADYLKSRR
ncbi:MAG: hypothetical protein HYX47_14780 [Burkholderiales bacterium]|nr:hypothetical protein [Burkholderiales bacterium]